MTDRELDDCIVPLVLEYQSSDMKSGNTDAGKAIKTGHCPYSETDFQ